MTDRLRVGLVGAGPWARSLHAPGLAAHPGVRLTTVWARRPAAAAELAAQHDAEPVGDFAELVSTVDVVAFAVPPAVQGEMAMEAARAGRHLILDKPIAADADTAQRLAGLVEDGGLTSIVMLTRRYDSGTRDWLAEVHRLGGWVGGGAQWLSGALLGGDFADSRWRWSDGALADVGPHTVDLLDAALGPVTDVLAAHRGSDDLWQLLLGHDGGATSTASLSLRLPVRRIECRVFGEHGERTLPAPGAAAQSYSVLLDEFVAMVRSGTTTHACDVRRGLHLQRVLAKAARLADGRD